MIYNFGVLYQSDSALHYAFEAIEFAKTCGIEHPPAVFLTFIGEQYRTMAQFDNALSYLMKAWQSAFESNKTDLFPVISNRIASVLYEMKNHKDALNWVDTSMMYCEQENRDDYDLNNLNIAGAINRDMGNYEKALSSFINALTEVKSSESKSEIANLQNNIASTYDFLSEYDSVIKYATASYENSLPRDLKGLSVVSTELLAKTYAKKGDYEQAYKYLRIYEGIRHDLFYEDRDKQISELNTKYQINEKEKQIEIQDINLAKKDLRIKQDQLTMYFFLVLFVVLIAFVVYMFVARKRLSNANHLLSEQNIKIQNQNKEIENYANKVNQAYSKLQELDEHKQAMTSMLVHDLKNPLNTLVNIETVESNENSLALVKCTSKKMLNLILNLLDINRAEENRIKLQKTTLSVIEILRSALEEVDFLLAQKEILVINQSIFDYKIEADREIMVRVFMNLLTNAIKFSPSQSEIVFDATIESTDILKLSIRDKGPGINNLYHDVIFEKFRQIKRLNSGTAASSGLGLAFCKMAVESHGWKIGVDSEPGHGAEFWITIDKFIYQDSPSEPIKDFNRTRKKGHTPELSDDDRQQLKPYLLELKRLDIYALSEIKTILSAIQNNKVDGLDQWLIELRQSVENFEKDKFDELIKQILK